MDNDDVIATLSDLIETCKKGEKRFRTCAEEVTAPDLAALLNKGARRYAEAGLELKVHLRILGGRTQKSGSSAGSADRRRVAFNSGVTGMDDAAMLAECEHGEDLAKKRYENALKKVLPPVILSIVHRHYEGILHRARCLERAATVHLVTVQLPAARLAAVQQAASA